jgi:hypothetical protein
LCELRVNAIFEDIDEASELLCDSEGEAIENCDFLEGEFPIREYLVPTLIELVVKEIIGAAYRPKDSINNAMDDLSDLASFVRQNMKSSLQKQLGA